MYADHHFPLAEQPIHKLYGGAITAHVMNNLRDVSKIRPLGDNQEQFIDLQTGATMTFEILKMGHQQLKDQVLKELVELSVYDQHNLKITNQNVQTKQLRDNLILLSADQTIETAGKVINKKFLLALYRLNQYNSDILIYFSTPDNNKNHTDEFLQSLESLTINDPQLFG